MGFSTDIVGNNRRTVNGIHIAARVLVYAHDKVAVDIKGIVGVVGVFRCVVGQEYNARFGKIINSHFGAREDIVGIAAYIKHSLRHLNLARAVKLFQTRARP